MSGHAIADAQVAAVNDTRWRLVVILLSGLVVRVSLAFATFGDSYDIRLFEWVGAGIRDAPLNLYRLGTWPYPPVYAWWAAVAGKIATLTALPFHGVVQIAPIAFDLGIAIVAWWWAGSMGAAPRVRAMATAAVALGPSFIVISGYQGQFDSVAILPALLGCVIWARDREGRAVPTGLLIGVGATLKTVPGLMLLAVLATSRSRSETLRVTLSALVVPALALAPYLLRDPGRVVHALRYSGIPGVGGLSLVVQPSLADGWLAAGEAGGSYTVSSHTMLLFRWSPVLVGLALAVTFVLLRARRVPVFEAAVLLWLVVYIFGSNFFFQYLIWILPFLVLSSRIRWAIALQCLAIGPAVVFYNRPFSATWIVDGHKVVMIGFWCAFAFSGVRLASRFYRERTPMDPPEFG